MSPVSILVGNIIPLDVVQNVLFAWSSCIEEDNLFEWNFVGEEE
jgi:hypothetical protein